MTYTTIPTGVNGSTVWNDAAWNSYFKGNLDDHQTRINALEAGGTTSNLYIPLGILLPGSGLTGGASATAHEFATNTNHRIRHNLTGVSEIELDAIITTLSAGGELGLQYTTDLTGATGWSNFDGTSATSVGEPKLSVGATGFATSGVQSVPAGAKQAVLMRMFITGDGTANPAVMAVRARLKATVPAGGGAGSQVFRTGLDGALTSTRSEDRVVGWTGSIDKLILHLGARSTSGSVTVSIYYADSGNTPGSATETITLAADAGGTAGATTKTVSIPIVETGQVAFAVTALGTNAQDMELILKGSGS